MEATAESIDKIDTKALYDALQAITSPLTKTQKRWAGWRRWTPRLIRRAIYLTWVAATGIVQKISVAHLCTMLQLWALLTAEERQTEVKKAKASSQNRRASIFENTAKGAMVISGVAGGIALLIFALPSAKGRQVTTLTVAVSLLFFAVLLTVWMSSPKLKVWLYKPKRVPAGLQQLIDTVTDKEFDKAHPLFAGFTAYLRTEQTREERDIRLLVDRRMLCLASLAYVAGVYTVIDYFFAR